MKLKNITFRKIRAGIAYILYHYFAQYLPGSYSGYLGGVSNKIRILLCRCMFKQCGKISTINRRVNFGTGSGIVMGDGSGIGEHTTLPPNTIIGKNVIIGRHSFILSRNHNFDRIDIPL